KARELVSQRENLRYERTRAFGIVRKIFINIGKKFEENKLIEKENDIFYLTKEEIFAFIQGTSVTQNIKALIDLRKNEFEKYKQSGAISERFATYGIVYQLDNDFFSTEKELPLESELKGVGCCVGIVEAKVRVLDNPHQLESLKGDILAAYSTDPGWVVLFPDAKGILVERGSLLSHSAIVAREMGKPCIVGIKGLLKTLKTGDLIEMNGSTGNIKIIKN
ncbi:MAG: phosphoenolpyruvate synthase, partial [Bacteroidetes bacterium]